MRLNILIVIINVEYLSMFNLRDTNYTSRIKLTEAFAEGLKQFLV